MKILKNVTKINTDDVAKFMLGLDIHLNKMCLVCVGDTALCFPSPADSLPLASAGRSSSGLTWGFHHWECRNPSLPT